METDYLTELDYYGVKIPSKSNFGRLRFRIQHYLSLTAKHL